MLRKMIYLGLASLALGVALHGAGQAQGGEFKRPGSTPEEAVKQLQAAVNARDAEALRTILLPTTDNLGREELLAGLTMFQAEDELQKAVGAEFCAVLALEPRARDFRIEIVSKRQVCDAVELKLRVTWQKEDANGRLVESSREVLCYALAGVFEGPPDRVALMLPEGFSTSSAEESQLLTAFAREWTRICEKTTQEVRDGKYQSVEEATEALKETLGNSEPFQKYLAFVLERFVKEKLTKTIDEAIQKVIDEAIQGTSQKAHQNEPAAVQEKR